MSTVRPADPDLGRDLIGLLCSIAVTLSRTGSLVIPERFCRLTPQEATSWFGAASATR